MNEIYESDANGIPQGSGDLNSPVRVKNNLWQTFKTFSWPKKILAIFGAYVAFSVALSLLVPASSGLSVDKFLESQQKISAINGKWQIQARRISVLIGDITSGSSADKVQIQTQLVDIQAAISPILTELADECRKLPDRNPSATGEEAAKDGAYEMLREWCRITPAQTFELYAVVAAQINDSATQLDIDKHINAYQDLERQKLEALKSGMTGLIPYVSGTDKATAETLLATVNKQLNGQ